MSNGQKQEQPRTVEDALVSVVNRDARVYQLPYGKAPKEGPKGELQHDWSPDRIVFAPGLNFVPRSKLEAAGFKGSEFQGRVWAQDIADVAEFAAIEIAGMTSSRQALQRWRRNEKRDSVAKAIDERLASKKPQGDED